MSKMKKLFPLAIALSSASAFAVENIDITKGVDFVDVSQESYGVIIDDSIDPASANIKPLEASEEVKRSALIYDRNEVSEKAYKEPQFEKDSYIGLGYVHPTGAQEYADDYIPSFSVKAAVVHNDFELKANYLSSGYKFNGNTTDINSFGLAINKGFLRTENLRVYLGAGYDNISLDGKNLVVKDGVVSTTNELNAHTFYGELGAEFAATKSTSVNTFVRYNFGYDCASVVMDDKVMKIYEDFGFGIGLQYDFSEKLAFGISHVVGSDLLEMTSIEAKYKF